MLTVRL